MENSKIIPAVKEQTIFGGECIFDSFKCYAPQSDFLFAKNFLANFCSMDFIEAGENNANILLTKKCEFDTEAYKICVGNKIDIQYKDQLGLRNALATLLQIMEKRENGYYIFAQNITDCPDANYRSVMLDLGRGVPKIERLKEDVKRFALVKCNVLHLHLMDSEGICYKSNVIKAGLLRGTEPYEIEQLKELVSFCKGLAIDIVPELEIPAHSQFLMPQYSELLCPVDVENQSIWTVCLGNEKTYELFSKLIEELAQIFPYKYLHIGGDEHYFADLKELNLYNYWDTCPVCKKKMQDEGLENTTELFYYMIRRIEKLAKAYGKQIIVWNDEIDISKQVNISRDCIIQFWRIANENRGPRKDCSYRKFLEQGFSVICSPFEYCYVDLEDYANPEKISAFNYLEYGNCAGYEKQVIGCETCVWEYANPEYTHYDYSLASSALLLLAKMWNVQNVCYDKGYRLALTKIILGENTPKGYDLFEIFGSIIPPRLNEIKSYARLDNELIDKQTLNWHYKILIGIKNTYSEIFLSDVICMLEKN